MIPVVLAAKPSGLRLVRLGCGCQLWVRLLPGGQVHRGRRVAGCVPWGCREPETVDSRAAAVIVGSP